MNAVAEGAAIEAAEQNEPTTKKLLYKTGIEFTMMPPVCSGARTNERGDSDIATYYAHILETVLRRKGVKFHECSRDGRAVECPTVPLTTWRDVKKAYEQIMGTMTDIGLVPSVGGSIGGGNHMHIGPMPMHVAVNLFRDIQNRPYLTWIFNEPDDATTANSFAQGIEEIPLPLREQAARFMMAGIDPLLFIGDRELNTEAANALLFFGVVEKMKPEWMPDDKGHMLRFAQEFKTVEFRFFDTPHSWEECEAQLQFVEAYLRWVSKTYADKPAEVMLDTVAKVQAITAEQAVAEFGKFIGQLGLDYARYEPWVKTNLALRYERGTRK